MKGRCPDLLPSINMASHSPSSTLSPSSSSIYQHFQASITGNIILHLHIEVPQSSTRPLLGDTRSSSKSDYHHQPKSDPTLSFKHHSAAHLLHYEEGFATTVIFLLSAAECLRDLFCSPTRSPPPRINRMCIVYYARYTVCGHDGTNIIDEEKCSLSNCNRITIRFRIYISKCIACVLRDNRPGNGRPK